MGDFMKKYLVILLIVILTFTLLGCSKKNDIRNGLEVKFLTQDYSEIVEEENGSKTMHFNYTIKITNNETYGVTILDVEPMFDEEYQNKSLHWTNIIEVNKPINPYANIELSGTVKFDVTGLGKRTLEKFVPEIKVFKLAEERYIQMISE